MKKFKITVSKNQQRYDIVIQSENEILARERVHKEGYSILSVEEINDLDIKGNKFIFTVEVNSEIKNGSIYGEDIFKAYLKLKKDFGYNVISIFAEKDKDKSEDEKNETLKKVQEEYLLYIQKFQKADKEVKMEVIDVKETIVNEDFYLKKEVEETYKLIDFVLKKVKSIVDTNLYNINEDQKLKLQNIYNSLISIKNSRNVNKLKEIGELALKKVGILELEYLEKTKNEEAKKLLNETNSLLKQLGSKDQFVEKSKDVGYMIKHFFSKVKEFFEVKIKSKSSFLDKETHSYIKTMVLLNKYKEKKEEINKEIANNFYIFLFPFGENKEKKDKLLAKKSVIRQNISLLKAKLNGKVYSYTKIVKGYKRLEEIFISLLEFFASYLKVIVYFYGLVFVLFFLLNYFGLYTINVNIQGINLILYLIIFYTLISFTRGFFSFIFNFVFFIFINIFFIVNF